MVGPPFELNTVPGDPDHVQHYIADFSICAPWGSGADFENGSARHVFTDPQACSSADPSSDCPIVHAEVSLGKYVGESSAALPPGAFDSWDVASSDLVGDEDMAHWTYLPTLFSEALFSEASPSQACDTNGHFPTPVASIEPTRTARRRAQNRASQRAYRARKDKMFEDSKAKVTSLEQQLSRLTLANARLRSDNVNLRQEVVALRAKSEGDKTAPDSFPRSKDLLHHEAA